MILGKRVRNGFHIPSKKELSRGNEYIEIPASNLMKFPTLQHIGTPSEPIVKVGDYVKVGQKIAKKVGSISANLHSSISGTVSKIEYGSASRGNHVLSIYIENDYKNELGYEILNRDYKSMSSEEIVNIIDEAGITGLGGASFPTAVKLNPPSEVEHIILNGAECEPYLTSDDTVMRNFARDIIIGLEIEMIAVGATKGYVLIEDDKPEAIESMNDAVKGKDNIQVVVAKAKYPQGDEKRVIESVLGIEIPFGEKTYESGVIVSNVSTAYAIKQAVCHNKPLYERIVTFTGEAMTKRLNALVKFGTPMEDCIKHIGGYDEGIIDRLVFGGPMMGVAQDCVQIPMEKSMNGVLALSKEEANTFDREPCIKCSSCVEVCPVGLQPFYLERLISNNDLEAAKENNLLNCIECGLCSYICPSHIPLVETFKEAKRKLRELELKRGK